MNVDIGGWDRAVGVDVGGWDRAVGVAVGGWDRVVDICIVIDDGCDEIGRAVDRLRERVLYGAAEQELLVAFFPLGIPVIIMNNDGRY